MEITRGWKSRREKFRVVLNMNLCVVCRGLAQRLIVELECSHLWPVSANSQHRLACTAWLGTVQRSWAGRLGGLPVASW